MDQLPHAAIDELLSCRRESCLVEVDEDGVDLGGLLDTKTLNAKRIQANGDLAERLPGRAPDLLKRRPGLNPAVTQAANRIGREIVGEYERITLVLP